MNGQTDESFEALLKYMRDSRGFDFTGYKSRRIGAPEMLERYFEYANGRYGFRKDLRRAVIFGRNDLVRDTPISRVDLLTCRNTLLYLNAETQRNVL